MFGFAASDGCYFPALLFAIAPAEMSAALVECHEEAVRAALGWLEDEAVFVRRGKGGLRFEHALRLGYLTRGDQLPRVKDVVASLSINPNTVLKAYRDLEQKGLIGSRQGQGTFVKVAPDTVGLAELTGLRRSLVTGWLRDAAKAGLDEDGISALFMSALRDFHDRPAEGRPSRRDGRRREEGVA